MQPRPIDEPVKSKTMRPWVKIDAPAADLSGFGTRFMNPGELDMLIHLVRSVEPRTMIEFGCNEGRTAAAILRNVPSLERYVGVDVLPGYQTIKEVQRKEVPAHAAHLVEGDPRFSLLISPRGSFDLSVGDGSLPECEVVFIAADHSRDGVLNDYSLAKSVVKKGLIIFHDDNGLPVVEVTETLNELYMSGVQIVHVQDTWLAYEKVGE